MSGGKCKRTAHVKSQGQGKSDNSQSRIQHNHISPSMAGFNPSMRDYALDITFGIASIGVAIFFYGRLMSYIEDSQYSNNESRSSAQQKATAAYNRLYSVFSNDKDGEDADEEEENASGEQSVKSRLSSLVLNPYEQSIAMEVVAPQEIALSFDDIGGLDDIIEELRESVIYPLTMPHLYAGHSSLLSAPSGVLLYGPPGCGKTMLAKALAHESGACFINLHISTLTEKWYGDSNKLVSAVFSLARKLQPSIVFIDEIDAVLSQRKSGEHEASGMVKAEYVHIIPV